MNIFKGDKVMLLNEFGNLNIGEVYEVANIINDTTIVLRNAKTKVAIASIDIEYVDKHFKKFEDKKTWTKWNSMVDPYGNIYLSYRTNGHKVQVKTPDGDYRSEASCGKHDNFNLSFGIKLAHMRCMGKILKNKASQYESELKTINSYITENKNDIKRLIRTLDDVEDNNVTE